MNRRPAWSSGWAVANACRPSRVVLVAFPSIRLAVSWSTVGAGDEAAARRAAAFAKLIRLSSVELLIHDVPPGQPATFGGKKSIWPIGAIALAAARKARGSAPVTRSVWAVSSAGLLTSAR